MQVDLPGGNAALAAFDAVFDQWHRRGLWRFRKEIAAFVAAWDWQAIFPVADRALFENRTLGYLRAVNSIEYAAHRWAQLCDGDFPAIVLRCGDDLDCRDHHRGLDGLVLPADHPFWQAIRPPFSYGCSCRVFGARSDAGAKRVGGDPGIQLPPDWQQSLPGSRIFNQTRRDVLAAVVRGDFDL